MSVKTCYQTRTKKLFQIRRPIADAAAGLEVRRWSRSTHFKVSFYIVNNGCHWSRRRHLIHVKNQLKAANNEQLSDTFITGEDSNLLLKPDAIILSRSSNCCSVRILVKSPSSSWFCLLCRVSKAASRPDQDGKSLQHVMPSAQEIPPAPSASAVSGNQRRSH